MTINHVARANLLNSQSGLALAFQFQLTGRPFCVMCNPQDPPQGAVH
jgi:hypothetical protein